MGYDFDAGYYRFHISVYHERVAIDRLMMILFHVLLSVPCSRLI